MSRTSLGLVAAASNSASFARVLTSAHNLPRDAGLIVRRDKATQRFYLVGCGPLFPAEYAWDAEVPLTPQELFGHVQACRAAWLKELVDFGSAPDAKGPPGPRPFQDAWKKPVSPKQLRWIGRRLALAGAKLFYEVFESGDERLSRVAERLRLASTAGHQLVMTITSAEFFVPWGLLYTHPVPGQELELDGANFGWEGFWALRHVVEHNPTEFALETRVNPNNRGLIRVSINVDDRIDEQLGLACIAPQLAFFKKLCGLDPEERRFKHELQTALASKGFQDRIAYFCCHGVGAGDPGAPNLADASLTLSDDEPITAGDISFWLKKRELKSHPVVFVNACQGGQMSTIFYRTLAAELLRRKAMALIGAQIDMPAVFAAVYARRFFREFLKRRPRVRLGPLMRTLAREFLKRHRNPLGMVYSLYRGADCYVHWKP